MTRACHRAAFAFLALALSAAIFYGCSSGPDYQGGGRQLYPPGGGGDGSVMRADSEQQQDDAGQPSSD